MKKLFRNLFVVAAVSALGGSLLVNSIASQISPVFANHLDNVCPNENHEGWVKVEGLSGLTYTFTNIPDGYVVTDNCMKVGSHDPLYGTGASVTNTTLFNAPGNPPAVCTAPGVPHQGCALQNISHASFKLEKIEDECEYDCEEEEQPCEYDCEEEEENDPVCEDDEELSNGICIEIDCPGGGECEVIIGDPDVTPTVTLTPTPTKTPDTSIVQSATGGTASSSDNKEELKEEVLEMAPTGTFNTLLSNGLLGLGLVFSTLAGATHVSKKKD